MILLKVEYFEKKSKKLRKKIFILWSFSLFATEKSHNFFPSNNSIFPVKFCPPGVLEDVVDACIILLDHHPLPPVSRKNATIHKKNKKEFERKNKS